MPVEQVANALCSARPKPLIVAQSTSSILSYGAGGIFAAAGSPRRWARCLPDRGRPHRPRAGAVGVIRRAGGCTETRLNDELCGTASFKLPKRAASRSLSGQTPRRKDTGGIGVAANEG